MNFKAVLAATVLASAAMSAMPAFADIDNCAGTSVCLWDDNQYQNKLIGRTAGESAIKNLGAADNNKMESWANNSNTYKACGWDGANGTNADQEWNENQHDDNVAPWNANEISSWRTKYGC